MLPLDVEQQRRVERLLRQKGVACPQCGSSDLASDGLASQRAGEVSVGVYCRNRGVQHENGFPVSPPPKLTEDEARQAGIPAKGSGALSDESPGETSPRG